MDYFDVAFGFMSAIILGLLGWVGHLCWILYKADMDFQIPTDEDDFI